MGLTIIQSTQQRKITQKVRKLVYGRLVVKIKVRRKIRSVIQLPLWFYKPHIDASPKNNLIGYYSTVDGSMAWTLLNEIFWKLFVDLGVAFGSTNQAAWRIKISDSKKLCHRQNLLKRFHKLAQDLPRDARCRLVPLVFAQEVWKLMNKGELQPDCKFQLFDDTTVELLWGSSKTDRWHANETEIEITYKNPIWNLNILSGEKTRVLKRHLLCHKSKILCTTSSEIRRRKNTSTIETKALGPNNMRYTTVVKWHPIYNLNLCSLMAVGYLMFKKI